MKARISIPNWGQSSSLIQSVRTEVGVHPDSSLCTGFSFSRAIAILADKRGPSSAAKNKWSYTSTTQHAFIIIINNSTDLFCLRDHTSSLLGVLEFVYNFQPIQGPYFIQSPLTVTSNFYCITRLGGQVSRHVKLEKKRAAKKCHLIFGIGRSVYHFLQYIYIPTRYTM